ncbi:MAG: hypothetical protein ACRDRN_21310 [Sciscionella sp.]
METSQARKDEFIELVGESLSDVGTGSRVEALTEATARQFFGSLYEDGDHVAASWTSAVTPLVAKLGNNVVSGDQALQSLMVNFVLKNAENIDQVKRMSAALAGIKQIIIGEVIQEFPHTSIEELIAAAREAGYDVQVLTA